jgi:NADPH2:quinone reductase
MQFAKVGGPEVLVWRERSLGRPGPGEVRIRHTAIGLNYIDIYHRRGLYPLPLPAIPGLEAAGIVEEVGEGVHMQPGTRVVYGRGPVGAYAEARIIAAKEVIPIPSGVSDAVAACAMLKGLTAWYLLHETFPVKKGDTVLIHAAAGGVGLILSQWAKKLGARVIGTAGSLPKATLAKQHGCDEVILYREEEDVAKRVKELTNGEGVPVVYDAVGKATFAASLDSLKPMGLMVSYGQASGPVPPLDLLELSRRGSLFITRPSLNDYMRPDTTYRKAAEAVLSGIASGDLRVVPAQQFPLQEAAEAHRALEARETMGSTVLIP